MTVPGLQLLPPTRELADQVLTWRHHPDVLRWLLMQEQDPQQLRDDYASYDGTGEHVVVAVLDSRAIGTAGVRVTDGMGQSGNEDEFVGREGWLGFAVDPAYAGRGLATALATEALGQAFGRLRLRRVQAGCFAANTGSWKVLEKLGIRREQHGVKDSFHAELGWLDGYTYALLAEEWPAGAVS